MVQSSLDIFTKTNQDQGILHKHKMVRRRNCIDINAAPQFQGLE
jgi:hypothetical protein